MNSNDQVTPETKAEIPNPEFGDREMYVVSSSGRAFSQRLIKLVEAEIARVAPTLEVDKLYPLEMLCAPDVWKALTKGERIAAGECAAYIVRANMGPLAPAGRNRKNACLYRLK